MSANRQAPPRAVARTAVLVILASISACSPGSTGAPGPQHKNVFGPRDYSDILRTTTGSEDDVGIPQLYNAGDQTVRIMSARLWSAAPEVVTDSVRAYSNANGNTEIGIGNFLSKYCRKSNIPHPVTDDVTPPHSIGDWYILIGFHIASPGTYHLTWVRITYKTAGHEYWQNVGIRLTAHVTRGGGLPSSC